MLDSFIVCMVQLIVCKYNQTRTSLGSYITQTVTALSINQHVENPVEK